MQQPSDSVEITSLRVPALARYARVVRMTAANLATMAGMNVDDVDDVRMAAEEAFVYACATGIEGTMDVGFGVSPEAMTMDFELGSKQVTEDDREPALVYSAFIPEAMCDECVIGDAPSAKLHLVKKIGDADAQR